MKTGLNKRQKTTAIYLGSRCQEFESPHSDHKNRCFRLKTAVFLTIIAFSVEPSPSSAWFLA